MSMAPLTLRLYGDPILQRTAEEVSTFDNALQDLIADMMKTVKKEEGVGLAAPQVGVSQRVIVVSDLAECGSFEVFVNPRILEAHGKIVAEEGCLSVPDVRAKVERHERVKVLAYDARGKKTEIVAEGLRARAFQHEIDHLDGILFIQRLTRAKRFLMKSSLEEIRQKAMGRTTGKRS